MLYDQLVNQEMALEVVKIVLERDIKFVAIDTETNGRDVRDGTGVAYGISLAYEDTAIYLPFRHTALPEQNYDLHAFLPYLQQIIDRCTVIYHNAKFDLVSLQTLGLRTYHSRFVDTMVLAHLVDEYRPWSGKSLDSCAAYYLDIEGKKNAKDSDYYLALKYFGYADMDAACTCEYAMWDAWLTLNLYHKLVPLLRKEKLRPTWDHKQEFIRLLIKMEGNGVRIDSGLCGEMAERGHLEMAAVQAKLKLNPGSTKDLGKLLIDKLHLPIVKLTPKGKPCFDKFAMVEYDEILERTQDETAQDIVTYRGWQKSVTSNYEPYVSLLSPDGRLRPNYNLHRTVTGRMSCNAPNLQQIPRVGEKPWNGRMKDCFIPQDGYVLIEGDYSQLEFRLSSAFAKEQVLLEAFADPDRDVFQEVADALGMERFEAKTLVYSIMYGAGARRISNVFGVSLDKGQQIRDNFFSVYRNLHKTALYASNYAKVHKRIPIWSGRNCHFTNVKLEAHKAYNKAVQGGAADIVERTMLRSDREGFNTDDCRMLLQVHDSIVWEIREDLVDKYIPELANMMARIEPDFGVTFKADLKIWGSK